MSGNNDNQSTVQKVASYVPGTEANRERKETGGAGSGMGTGYQNQGATNMAGSGGYTTGTGGGIISEPTPGRLGEHGAIGYQGNPGQETNVPTTGTQQMGSSAGVTNRGTHQGTGTGSVHTPGAGSYNRTGPDTTGAVPGGAGADRTGTGINSVQTGSHSGMTDGIGASDPRVNEGGYPQYVSNDAGAGMAGTKSGSKNEETLATKIKKVIPGTEENKMKKAGQM